MLSIKKIVLSLLNNLVDFMIGIGLLIVVTRFYSTEDTGKWILFTTVFFLVTRIREGIIQTALNKSGSGVEEEVRLHVMKMNATVNFLIEIVVSIIIFILGVLKLPPTLSEFFILYPIGSIPWAMYRWQVYAHLLTHKVDIIFKGNIIVFILLVITMSTILYYKLPVESLVYVLCIGGFGGAVYGIGTIGFKKLWKSKYRKVDYQILLKYGGHGALRGFTGNLTNRINVFLTAGLLSITDTALYGVAQKYVHLILMPNGAIQSLVFPKFCEAANKGNKPYIKYLFEKTVSSLMGFFIVVVLLIALLAGEIVPIVNGPEYVGSIPLIICILMMSSITAPFGNAFGSCINAIGKPAANTYLLIGVSVVNIFSSWFMISRFGLWGTILGPLVAELVSLLWASIILKKEVSISYLNCFVMIPSSYKSFMVKANQSIFNRKKT